MLPGIGCCVVFEKMHRAAAALAISSVSEVHSNIDAEGSGNLQFEELPEADLDMHAAHASEYFWWTVRGPCS